MRAHTSLHLTPSTWVRSARPWALVALAVGALSLAGCLGTTLLIVSPAATIVELGGTVAFTVTTPGGAPVTGVTWAVSAGPGSIDATTGVYTAPSSGIAAVTNVTITATKGTASGSATVTLVPPSTAALVDPRGDAFGGGGTVVNYDVLSLKTSRNSTTFTITVTFDPATPPTIPPAGGTVGAGDLSGFIDFDTDQSVVTGAASANSTWCPTLPISAIGSEFFLSLFQRNVAGNYDIIDTATLADVGDASVTVSGTVITLTIPLTELGNDDGNLNLNSTLGDNVGATDCLPDEGAAIASSEGEGGVWAPELSVVGNPHLDYLNSLGLSWQTPSATI